MTVALPTDLLEAADRAIREGKAHSRNELIARALRRELAEQDRRAIDAAFLSMAEDAEARAEAQAITEEFALADWEAFRAGERE
jgi:metal-responsive CopG/Arc/MetJ family transcriptional regulator